MEQEFGDQSICNAAIDCSDLFDRIIESSEAVSTRYDLAKELRGKFSIWAYHIGALNDSKVSLDARLIGHDDIKGMFLELLVMIQKNLQEELDLKSKSQPWDLEAGKTTGPSVLLGLNAVHAALTQLNSLAIAIRRSAAQSLRQKAALSTSSQDEEVYTLFVKRKFPYAKNSLVQQLSKSIQLRGRWLLHQQRHNRKIGMIRERKGTAASVESDSIKSEDEVSDKLENTEASKAMQVNSMSETNASNIDRQDFQQRMKKVKSSFSHTGKGSSIQENRDETFDYPTMPSFKQHGLWTGCTICSKPLEVSRLTEQEWRAHVDSDLEPYICLSEECEDPIQFFVHDRDWKDHMQRIHTIEWERHVHTTKWHCTMEHTHIPENIEEFDNKNELIQHLSNAHGDTLTRSQILARTRRSKITSTRDPFTCPLCDRQPDDILSHTEEKRYALLWKHIARHLKALAFYSLYYLELEWDCSVSVEPKSPSFQNDKSESVARSARDESFETIPQTIVQGKERVVDDEIFDDLQELNTPFVWPDMDFKHFPKDDKVLEQLATNMANQAINKASVHTLTTSRTHQSAMTQPDSQEDIQQFLHWVQKSCDYGIQEPVIGGGEVLFLPYGLIDSYFRDNNFHHLNKILDAIFDKDPPVDAETILRTCPKVFCILLSIGQGRFIQHFIQYENLYDLQLPFDPTHPPADFPMSICPMSASDDQLLQTFCAKQWKFCAKPFRNLAGLRIPEDQILPIKDMERLAGGGSAAVHKIVLYEEYNELKDVSKQNLSERYANTFILKTYRTQNAEKYYNSEIEAFRRLKPSQESIPCIIGYHGSFIKGETYNVLLEYADKGTLEDYFQNEQPPASGIEICHFWNGLFQIIRALINIHNVPPLKSSQDGPSILRGWHQDVKPTNILISSDNIKSPYEWNFKLADLGLSHFRKVSFEGSETDSDSYGTRAYGAPECYRSDQVIYDSYLKFHQNVDIWSLGAVYSEAAVWIAYGYHGPKGLVAYRDARKLETDKINNFKDGDCFHDGDKVLKVVSEQHEELLNGLRRQDYVTKFVLESMVSEMLDDADCRPTAKVLWGKVRRINERAMVQLNNSSQASPTQSNISPASKSQNRFSQRKKPPVSPTSPLPTDSPKSPVAGSSAYILNDRVQTRSPENFESEGEENYHAPLRVQKGKSVSTNMNSNEYFSHQDFSQMSLGTEDPPSSLDVGPPSPTPFREMTFNKHHLANHSENTHTPGLSLWVPEVARFTQVTKPPLPYLSVSDAKLWKSAEKQQKRIWGKKHEQHGDFTLLDRLSGRDHVFLVDDSATMDRHWNEVQELCSILAYMVKEKNPNGFDLYFTVSQKQYNFKHATELEKVFGKKTLTGETDIKAQLSNIITAFEARLRPPTSNNRFQRSPQSHESITPMSLYILTNALWEAHSDPAIPINFLVKKLTQNELHNHHFMIQFIHFGTAGKEVLKRLDSGLKLDLDIVDTEPSDGNIWKMLLGSTSKRFDVEGESEITQNPDGDFTEDTTTPHDE